VRDYFMLAAVVTVVTYVIGVANRGWTSPLDVIRRIRHDMHQRWPEDQTPDEDVSDDDVVSDVGSRFVRAESLIGPRPIEEIIGDQDDRQGDDGAAPVPRRERREWVALRLRPDDPLKLPLTEIDRRGAALFGCSEKTIERDRQHLTGRKR
jgi:hypothetical protein